MFDLDADYQVMTFKYYIGGPLDYIVDFTLQAGIAVNPALAATSTADWGELSRTIAVNSASAFPQRAALNIVGPLGDNWFTYESRDANNFYEVRRIWGNDQILPTGSTVTCWREVTDRIDECSLELTTTDVEGYYSFTIDKGTPWESLIQRQDATLLVMESHYDSTYQQNTPFAAMYCGFFGPVQATGSRHGSMYQVTAHGWWEYLKSIQGIPRTYGQEKIIGSRTASSTLLDVGSEPTEGVRPTDFDVKNTGDVNKYTLWISENAPVQSTLSFRTGTMGALNQIARGIGLPKIQQIYCSGRDTINSTAQDHLIIELYNPDTTGEDDNGVIDKKWHAMYWNGFIIENSRMQRLYMWLKNGYSLGEHAWEAQTFLYLVYNEKTAKQIANFPPGAQIVELRGVDGFEPGFGLNVMSIEDTRRNVGGGFYLDPRGDWLAIRQRTAMRPGFYWSEPFNAIITADDVAISQTLTVNSTAGYASKGSLRVDSVNCLMTYDGIDATHFYNVKKHRQEQFNIVGQAVPQMIFAEVWADFVGWGDKSLWGKYADGSSGMYYPSSLGFPHLRKDMSDGNSDGIFEDQNTSGVDALKVWGTRSDGNFTGGFQNVVAPGGILPGQSIRRKALIGVYAGPNSYNTNTFQHMDGGTDADWEVKDIPLWGNPAALESGEWIDVDLGEFKAATVLVDNSDIGLANGQILVGDDEASNYAPFGQIRASQQYALSHGGFGGGVEFTYTHTDRNTFYGVQKIIGAGTDLADSTLKQIIDTTPSQDTNSPARYEARNYYIVSYIDLLRWISPVSALVVADNTGYGLNNATITLDAGQGAFFDPNGGEVLLYASTDSQVTYNDGLIITNAQFGPTTFTYTSLSGDTFSGVVKSNKVQNYTGMQAMSANSFPSFWTDMTIRGTRRFDPNDPGTYLGNSTDWEDIATVVRHNPTTDLGQIRSFGNLRFVLPQSSKNNGFNFFKRIRAYFYMMSDGKRVKVNSFDIYRAPTDRVGDTSSNIYVVNGAQTASTIANIILAEAGVPQYQRDCGSHGMPVGELQISSGSAAQSITNLCKQNGLIVYETLLGKICIREDPSMPGASPQLLDIQIGPNTVWGDVTRREKSFHEAGQVELIASNPTREEQYTVTEPNVPSRMGSVKRIDKFIVPDITTATAIAKRIYRKSNGGLVLDIPLGMFYAWKPFELIRVKLDIDGSGIEVNRDFIIKGYRAKLDRNGLTGTLTIEEYVPA